MQTDIHQKNTQKQNKKSVLKNITNNLWGHHLMTPFYFRHSSLLDTQISFVYTHFKSKFLHFDRLVKSITNGIGPSSIYPR